MPQASTNSTFNPGAALVNVKGLGSTPVLAVEFLTADPTDLATNFPRLWINTTTFILKYSTNGSTIKSVALT